MRRTQIGLEGHALFTQKKPRAGRARAGLSMRASGVAIATQLCDSGTSAGIPRLDAKRAAEAAESSDPFVLEPQMVGLYRCKHGDDPKMRTKGPRQTRE